MIVYLYSSNGWMLKYVIVYEVVAEILIESRSQDSGARMNNE
jgi:hypothetical protein